jgi:deoxyribodipyrimidine photo-lyase
MSQSLHTPFHLVWFRNDLRTLDNLAFHSALQRSQASGFPVVALYVAYSATWQQHHMAPIKQDLIKRRVAALADELAELGVGLITLDVRHFNNTDAVFACLQQHGMQTMDAEVEYELREQQRDARLHEQFSTKCTSLQWHHGQCQWAPGQVLSKTGDVYKVFTPFKRRYLELLRQHGVHCLPKPQPQMHHSLDLALQLERFLLTQSLSMPWLRCENAATDALSAAYVVKQSDILLLLREFCQQRVQDYQRQRDFPAIDGTSRLSAYFAIGAISPRQAMARLQLEVGDAMYQDHTGAAVWLSELIWREFYKHILVAYPQLIKHQPFQAETANLAWGNNTKWFEAWCQGQTGYPIVDAAMRQLNSTGWMHNRLRMIVASFLVKDLQIDWRWGEAYFMRTLIDGDFAANNGGWQWAASTGTDAAPYFRIFNPVTQSEKFDPDGRFIRQYVPELANVRGKAIHWPHPLPAGVRYSRPIVDHAKARLITLAMFKAVRPQASNAEHDDLAAP